MKVAALLVMLLAAAAAAAAAASPVQVEVPAELADRNPAVRALETNTVEASPSNTRTVVEGAVLVDDHTAGTTGLDRVDVVQPRTVDAAEANGCSDACDDDQGAAGGSSGDAVPSGDSDSDDEVSFQSDGGEAPVDPSKVRQALITAADAKALKPSVPGGVGDDGKKILTPAEQREADAKAKAKADADRKAGNKDQDKVVKEQQEADKAREEAADAKEAKTEAAEARQDAGAKAAAARRAEEAGRDGGKGKEEKKPEPRTETEALPLTKGKTSPFGKGYGAPAASVLGNVCVLSGLAAVSDGGWTADAARLPVACAPKGGKRILGGVSNKGVPLRVNLNPRGDLSVMGPSSPFLSFNGMVVPSASAKPVAFAAGAAWEAFGQGFSEPSFAVEGSTCTLSGVLRLKKGAAWAALLGTLPPACRPADRLVFAVAQQQNTHRVDVLPNGRVQWVAGKRSQAWLSLDGVAFGVAARGQHGLSLAEGVEVFGESYRAPSSRREDSVCFLSGLVKGKRLGAKALVATLPTDCRPEGRQVFYLLSGVALARVDVLENGEMYWVSGRNAGWLSLDGAALVAKDFDISEERRAALAKNDKKDKSGAKKPASAEEDAAKALSAGLQPERNLLKLFGGFKPFGRGTEPPSAENYDGLCLAQGQLGEGRPAAVAGQFATECNPATGRLTLPALYNGRPVAMDLKSGTRSTFQFLTDAKKTEYAAMPGALYPAKGSKPAELPLREPWTAAKGFAPPTYTLSGKLCVLSGRARRSSMRPSHVARLPNECRPAARLSFVAVEGSRAGQRVDVHPNGFVQWVGTGGKPTSQWVSLTGVAFTVADFGDAPAVDVATGAASGGGGFARASYARHGKLCVLAGAVSWPSADHGTTLAQLPSDCWPAFRTAVLVRTDKGAARADVGVTGVVTVVSGPGGWKRAHLDGAVLLPSAADEHLEPAAVGPGEKPVTQTDALRLVNKWRAYGSAASLRGAYADPDVTRAGDICILHGMARGGDWKRRGVATIKGAGCRPRGGALSFNLHGEEGVTWRTDVNGKGVVSWKGAANTAGDWLSLSGAAWFSGAASPLTTGTTWKNRGSGLRGAGFTVAGGGAVCLVSGAITASNGRVGGGGSLVARLPSRCRPSGIARFSLNQGDGSIQVEVGADGRVRLGKGTQGSQHLSLAGITFPVAKAESKRLPLGGSWKPAGGKLAEPSFTLAKGGACALGGTAKGTLDPKDRRVATLPAECRPEAAEVFTSADSDGLAQRVDVLPDGTVLWMGDTEDDKPAAGRTISLDGILFFSPGSPAGSGKSNKQEAAAPKGAPHKVVQTGISFRSGWRNYGESYETARVSHIGPLCVVSGKAHTGRLDGTVLVLPPSCRPRGTNVFNALWHGGATARVDVYADGRVSYKPLRFTGRPTGLSLSGLTFAHSSAKLAGLEPAKGFKDIPGVEPLGFFADGDLCFLAGATRMAKAGRLTKGALLARLPASCRPDRTLFFGANSQGATVSVSVAPGGHVRVARATGLSAAANWVSLSGLVFTRSPADYNRLAPGSAWKDSGVAATRLPGYKMHGKVCVLSGALAAKKAEFVSPGSVLTTLPDECRPAGRLGFGVNAPFPQTVRVEKDGRVVWLGGRLAGGVLAADKDVNFVSLDGIHFPVAA